jgi:methyl-accepting chemotaxis protein
MTQIQKQKFRRKIFYVNPRFQGGAALVFSAAVVLGGGLFGWLVYRDLGQALWDASMRGHYQMTTPFEIVRGSLLWHLAALFGGISLLGLIVSLLIERATKAGVGRCIEVFHAAAEGDLTTPTGDGGLDEFSRFGGHIDAARSLTLDQVREIREEAAALAGSGASPEEFDRRWDEIKRKIRGVAP